MVRSKMAENIKTATQLIEQVIKIRFYLVLFIIDIKRLKLTLAYNLLYIYSRDMFVSVQMLLKILHFSSLEI